MGTLIKLVVVIAVAFGAWKIWQHKHRGVVHTFEVHGGEAYDAVSNLTWQRCAVGQHYSGSGCEGGDPGFRWDAAQRTGDGTWRVPTEKEIATLIDPDKVDKGISPAIDNVVFPRIASSTPPFWTSSHSSGASAWYARFSKGSDGIGSEPGMYRQAEINEYGVLLVHDGR